MNVCFPHLAMNPTDAFVVSAAMSVRNEVVDVEALSIAPGLLSLGIFAGILHGLAPFCMSVCLNFLSLPQLFEFACLAFIAKCKMRKVFHSAC